MKLTGTDIYMTRGDTEGIIVNLTGYTPQAGDTVEFTVRRKIGNAPVIYKKAEFDGARATIRIEPEDTERLRFGDYVEVTDTITLDTTIPVVTVTGPDKTKISKVSGFSQSVINFTTDVEFVEYKVCVVPQTSSTQDVGTVIPNTNGSTNTSGTEGNYPASQNIQVTITGADLELASAGDGLKIVKVFVKAASGLWSVA